MQARRIEIKNENALIKRITGDQNSIWKAEKDTTLHKYNITEEDIRQGKYRLRNKVDRENEMVFMERILEETKTKSKTKHYLDHMEEIELGKRPAYMNTLKRKTCRVILKTRSRMLPVKENNTSKQNGDETCRFCKKVKETQKHVIQECTSMRQISNIVIEYQDIFKNTNIDKLREIGEQLLKIEEILEEVQ